MAAVLRPAITADVTRRSDRDERPARLTLTGTASVPSREYDLKGTASVFINRLRSDIRRCGHAPRMNQSSNFCDILCNWK
ncbi:MAG: hypothetical protein ABI192_16165 [Bradyrhizobium sp.]